MTDTAAKRIADLARTLGYLSADEKAAVSKIVAAETKVWEPLAGPQTMACECQADILYYGGSAGGGKSDMLLGLSITEHSRSIIFRREAKQLIALQDRLLNEILKSRKGWNGQDNILRLASRQVEFGSCKDPGDEVAYQGRPHDLIGFDEITHFLKAQFVFLTGWNRTTIQGQRCRVVCTGNPPTDADGAWVIEYWGPWLDPKHPNPARPGELRWYAMIDGEEAEVENGTPFEHDGQMVQPRSRTFIPSDVEDNPFLMTTGYRAVLDALPEPLRSQMLKGDFTAGRRDNPWQVIPTAWIDAAMARWTPEGGKGLQMDSAGVDPARGGADEFLIATRYGGWYAPPIAFPGQETPDGAIGAGLVVSNIRDGAPVHIDVIGIGGSVYDHLKENNVHVVPINSSEKTLPSDLDKASGKLRFRNQRALLTWRFRELLDPQFHEDIALPPDSKLKADLCSYHWKLTSGGIQIEAKEDIKHGPRFHPDLRPLGRSPDRGDAYIMCGINTVKIKTETKNWREKKRKGTWRSR
jgi:hypothetical protein